MPEINIEVDFRPVTLGLDDLADAYGPRARKAVVRAAIRRTLRESVAKIRARGISYSRSLAKSATVRSQDRKTRRRKGRRVIGLAVGLYPRVGPGRFHSFPVTARSSTSAVSSTAGKRVGTGQGTLKSLAARTSWSVYGRPIPAGGYVSLPKTSSRQWRNRLIASGQRT